MLAVLTADSASPLAALRSATREHHHRIDRLLDLHALADRSRYIRVLEVFHGFLPAWEQAVLSALPLHWHAWMQQRSRRHFLEQDVRAMGLAPLTRRVTHPPLTGPAAAWGSTYVIEGSALGGQVITRVLAANGLDTSNGAAYFRGWGAATGAMWREFRGVLEAELQAPGAVEQACEAACLTFDTLTVLLDQALHERAAAA